MFVINNYITFNSRFLNRITLLMITIGTLLQVSVAKRKTQLAFRAFTLEHFFVGRHLERVKVSGRRHVKTVG